MNLEMCKRELTIEIMEQHKTSFVYWNTITNDEIRIKYIF